MKRSSQFICPKGTDLAAAAGAGGAGEKCPTKFWLLLSSAAAEPAFAMITVETLPIADKHSLRDLFYSLLLASIQQQMLMGKLEALRELAVQGWRLSRWSERLGPKQTARDSTGW